MRTNNYLFKNKSVVLLIGVSQYEDKSIPNIPNVESNINQMKRIFVDTNLIGVNEKNLIVSFNENALNIKKHITDACNKANSSDYTLFVYFTGHGLMSTQDLNVYLAGSDTSEKYLKESGISIKYLKDTILNCYAGKKILVLDACHSGQIHKAMGDSYSLFKNFDGVHIVSSTSEDECAYYPKKHIGVPTYFTNALISRIKDGMNNSSTYLTLSEIVESIKDEFCDLGLPLPIQSIDNEVVDVPFVKNVYNTNVSIDFEQVDNIEVIDKQLSEIETEWNLTLAKNDAYSYFNFIQKFPKCRYSKMAELKLYETEENEKWVDAENQDTISAYLNYVKSYPNGKYIINARKRIVKLSKTYSKKSVFNTEKLYLFASIVTAGVFAFLYFFC
ncbi:MAG: caspase family protein [Bacteroidales bacterium]|nr:caspase family protein [Bacteroidales bacterium]